MIALDTNIFIYTLEGNEEFGPRAEAVLRQAQGSGSASMFVYLEALSHHSFKDQDARAIAELFLDRQNLVFVELDKSVLLLAATLRAQFTPKLGAGDAIHIASAIHAGADTFITNDQALTGLKIKNLKITTL